MLEFFSSIFGFFEIVFGVIVNIFESLSVLMLSITSGNQFFGVIVAFLPSFLSASFLATAAIAVVKILIGR